MGFKKGDTIVCINNNVNLSQTKYNLTLFKSYYTIAVHYSERYVFVKDDTGVTMSYNVNKFILLDEFRRKKLEKIKDEIQKRRYSSLCT